MDCKTTVNDDSSDDEECNRWTVKHTVNDDSSDDEECNRWTVKQLLMMIVVMTKSVTDEEEELWRNRILNMCLLQII